MDKHFLIGMDVGSTTVKSVVIDAASDQILWQDYQRHDTKQPEKVLEFLKRFETEIDGYSTANSRMFITGSGGNGMTKFLGAKFVQEVNAVSLAVERMYPECGSVIELGGQDAKIIIFKKDPETGRKKKIPSMNDKCAGGTGAVIDKINAKLRIPAEQLCNIPKIWEERNTPLPEAVAPEDLIQTPDNAQYFAAIGSIEFGKTEEEGVGQYLGWEKLEWYVNVGRDEEKAKRGGTGGLAKDEDDLAAFKRKYHPKKFVPATFQPGELVEGFIGIDGGSTSTKAVLISKDHKRRILAKTYQLSKGNPIEDTVEVLQKLDRQVRDQGADLKILGVGTTGYAKEIMKDVIGADAALV